MEDSKFQVMKEDSIDMTHIVYEDESCSRLAFGKKKYITHSKFKLKKGYLLDSSKKLHKKFVQRNTFKNGYSTFCHFFVLPKVAENP